MVASSAGAAEAAGAPPAGKDAYRGLLLEMTGDSLRPVNVWDASGNPVLDPFYDFAKKGLALVDRDYSLRLEGGTFSSASAEEYLGSGLRTGGGELTLAAYFQPSILSPTNAGCVIGYGTASNELRFALLQEGSALQLRLTPAESKSLTLCSLTNAEPFHFTLAIGKKEIVFYRNGEKAGTHPGLPADFPALEDGRLYFGNDAKDARPWRGRLERVALYNKILAPEEARKAAMAILEDIRSRPTVPRIEIEGTLLTRSTYTMPWKEGFDYREVLSVCEYKINRVLSGDYKGEKMHVAEWMYVDRIFLSNSVRKPGASRRIVVEELTANPQLSKTQRDNTLDDIEADVYYDLSPIYALPENEQPKSKK